MHVQVHVCAGKYGGGLTSQWCSELMRGRQCILWEGVDVVRGRWGRRGEGGSVRREEGVSPFRLQGRVSWHPTLHAARSLSAAQLRGRGAVA